MPTSLHQFLFNRLAQIRNPTLTTGELARFPADALQVWTNAGILQKTATPLTVWKTCDDGICREVIVHADESGFYGISDDPDCLVPEIPLTEADITHYAIRFKLLYRAITRANGFTAIANPKPERLCHIGNHQGRQVFFLAPVWSAKSYSVEAIRLADELNGLPALVVTPTPTAPPVGAARIFRDARIETRFLEPTVANPFALGWSDEAAISEVSTGNEIEFDGVYWILTYRGKKSEIRDSNNARYVIYLIYHARHQFSHIELWTVLQPHQDPDKFERILRTGAFVQEKDVQIDPAEIHAIEEDLRNRLQEAEENNDDRLCEYLEGQISQVEGFRKLPKTSKKTTTKSSPYETAKATINRARRETLAALRKNEFGNDIADHLKISITPGDPGFLVYSPNPFVEWSFKNIPENLRERPISPK